MVAEDQKHDARVGRTFTGRTHSMRSITLGKVVRFEEHRAWPYEVAWYDEHGKHLEWFMLNDPSIEFRDFKWIS